MYLFFKICDVHEQSSTKWPDRTDALTRGPFNPTSISMKICEVLKKLSRIVKCLSGINANFSLNSTRSGVLMILMRGDDHRVGATLIVNLNFKNVIQITVCYSGKESSLHLSLL